MTRRIRKAQHLKLFAAGISLTALVICALTITARIVSSAPAPWVTPLPSTTFNVTNTDDSGPGSLRQAVLDANATTGADIIAFAIPGAGPHIFKPQSSLPSITEAVTIDGYTQPGSSPNTNALFQPSNAVIRLELDGSQVTVFQAGRGFEFQGTGSVVRGFAVNNFGSMGVNLAATDRVEGCYIGTDVTGTVRRGNYLGVTVGSDAIVGGNSPASRNVISGNQSSGVFIFGSRNVIAGNHIGTAADAATGLGNGGNGVEIAYVSNNHVGGMQPGAGNLMAFNAANGIFVGGTETTSNVTVRGNRFSANNQRGILLYDGDPIQNDEGDADLGPNRQQNYPELISATSSGAGLTVRYRVSSASTNAVYPIFVDFYLVDPGGDEGSMLVGTDTYAAASAQIPKTVSFIPTAPVDAGARLVAIATDSESFTGVTYGNTSAFSPRITVGASPAIVYTVTNTNNSGANSLRQAITDANNDGGNSAINITAVGTISLLTALPALNQSVAINGPGANLLTVRRNATAGTPSFRVFKINSGVTANISGVTISNGNLTGLMGVDPDGAGINNAGTLTLNACLVTGNDATDQSGGGIYNRGTLTVESCTVSGNHASQGAGISGMSVFSNLTINNSTVSGNVADYSGGGICNRGVLFVWRSTITANRVNGSVGSGRSGGGIESDSFPNSGPVRTVVGSSIIAGNTAPSGQDVSINDLTATLNSLDYNLFGNTNGLSITGATTHNINNQDARLLPLENNGGPVPTHALRFDSPALEAGTNASPITADGRGFQRIVDGDLNGVATVDIGAFEVQSLIVSNTNDSGTGSLRQTLLENNSNGPAVVIFNIPVADPNCAIGSVCTIAPASPLPAITKSVRLAGYTQPGARRNTLSIGNDGVLKIELNGAGASEATGLNVAAPSSIVEGLVINRFTSESGITLNGANAHHCILRGNRIGTNADGTAALPNFHAITMLDGASNVIGDNASDSASIAGRNLISGNSHAGISIFGAASNTVVVGNYIGTNADGNAILANGSNGIEIVSAESNLVGGISSSARNVISGNTQNGIMTSGDGANNNTINGNYIGTNASGTSALRNGVGVHLFDGFGNTIGGPTLDYRNVISGNADGVVIGSDGATFNTVRNNYIGTAADGTSPLGNSAGNGGHGVAIVNSNDNSVTSNRIAYNSAQGIYVISGVGNSIFANAIHTNGGLGIDLGPVGPNANDDRDADTGANNLQNYPVILTANYDGANLTVAGTLNSTPGKTFRLQFFASATCDNGGLGEGASPIYFGNGITTDANGNATFNFTFPVSDVAGQVVTATAMSNDRFDTSEFSLCRPVFSLVSIFQFSAPTYNVNEDATTADITLTRTGGSAGEVAVVFQAIGGSAQGGSSCGAPGVDFVNTSGSFIWPHGDSSPKTFTIPICNDHDIESAVETVELVLMDPSSGTTIGPQGTAVLLVHDNDTAGQVRFSAPTYMTDEGNSTVTFTVTRTGVDGPHGSVDYSTLSGSATGSATCGDAADYINGSGTLTWAAGEMGSKTGTINICNDAIQEQNEAFTLALTNPNGVTIGTQTSVGVVINDNDDPGQVQFSVPTSGIVEANATLSFTVTRTALDGPAVSVDYASVGGTATAGAACGSGADFINAPGTLSWAAGDISSRTVTLTFCEDTIVEGDETVHLNLTNPSGGVIPPSNPALLITISDDDLFRQVTNTNDNGVGSLRQALADVSSVSPTGTGSINFAPGLAGTITLLTALPDITRNLRIEGPGAKLLSVKRSHAPGTPQFRIFTVGADSDVYLSGLTLANGRSNSSGGAISNAGTLNVENCSIESSAALFGGGVTNQGSMTLTNSTVVGNTSLFTGPGLGGGGIQNFGQLLIVGCTISGNSAAPGSGYGGGISNGPHAQLTIAYSTITANTAFGGGTPDYPDAGGGIFQLPFGDHNPVIRGSIIAGNIAPTGPDLAGSFTSDDYNLIGSTQGGTITGEIAHNLTNVDARLAPLADNGGPTRTHALLTNSPAIDKGDNREPPATDQRGLPRVSDGDNDGSALPDVGAFELQSTCSIAFLTLSLPSAVEGANYNQLLAATGGTTPYSFSLTSGALPTGLSLSADGVIFGTVAAAGSFNFEVTVSDANGCFRRRAYTLVIDAAPACAIDVTSQLSIVRGGFRQNFVTRRFIQTVTIKNMGTAAVTGPLSLMLDSLPGYVALYNRAGVTTCFTPLGNPYVNVPVGADSVLTPGESITVVLEFTNSNTQQSIAYLPHVLSGATGP